VHQLAKLNKPNRSEPRNEGRKNIFAIVKQKKKKVSATLNHARKYDLGLESSPPYCLVTSCMKAVFI